MKTHPVGTELFHVSGQMDRHDEAISCFFCNFANVRKYIYKIIYKEKNLTMMVKKNAYCSEFMATLILESKLLKDVDY